MKAPIQFDKIPWDNSLIGLSQKVFSDHETTIRLVKFNDQFIEENWCVKNHMGYVLHGQLKLDLSGEIQVYNKGDGLLLNSEIKHKIIIEKNSAVELILFENT